MTLSKLTLPLIFGLLGTPVVADVQTRDVPYTHDKVALQGYLAVNDAVEQPKGAVLIVHAWWGLDDYAKGRARQLAELGYTAFAIDMYGQGKNTKDPEQAGAWSGEIYQDRALARTRVNAGLDAFRDAAGLAQDTPVVAIGYCFGGTTVVELAYHNPPGLAGVVSFHGNPKPAQDDDAITAKIMICHGDADPLVSDESLDRVTDSLESKNADWLLIRYGNAKHSFTDPAADTYNMPPVGYDKAADRRSWQHMLVFLSEIFPNP